MLRHTLLTLLLSSLSIIAIAQVEYRVHYFIPYDKMSERQQYRAQKSAYALSIPSITLNGMHAVDSAGSTTFTRSKRNGFGIGIMMGGFYNLGEFNGGTGILALEAMLSVNTCNYKFDKMEYFGLNRNYTGNFSAYTLPFILMYKRGAEAQLSRERKTMYSLGVGVSPGYATVNILGAEGKKWVVQPQVMGEYGFLTGNRALKFRATYFPLKQKMFDGKHKLENDVMLRSQLSVSSGVVISILWLVNSNRWG